MPAAEFYKDA